MKEKIAAASIAANVVLAAGKITVGLISNSAAILAEGTHSLMDIFSSVISYLGIKVAKKPGDQKHPYGHYKFEVLAGAVITLILFATGLGIIYESYQNLFELEKIKLSYAAFGMMMFSAVVNEVMSRLKIHFGKEENSVSLLSDGFHSRIDVFTSLAVFVGLFLTRYFIYADSVLAFLIGLYIIKESFSLGRDVADSLLDVSAGEETEKRIRDVAGKLNVEINSLKTQKKGSVVTANLEIKLPSNLKVKEAAETSEKLRKELMEEIGNLSYVAIQIKSHDIETGFYRPAFGQAYGWQRKGRFKEKIEEAEGKGPGGMCACPKCGYQIPHERGVPCSSLKCPDCGTDLQRKE